MGFLGELGKEGRLSGHRPIHFICPVPSSFLLAWNSDVMPIGGAAKLPAQEPKSHAKDGEPGREKETFP